MSGVFVTSLLAILAGFVAHNNFGKNEYSIEELKQSHNNGVQWLIDNRELLNSTHNPALWEMITHTIETRHNSQLASILSQYRTANARYYRNHPLRFQDYGSANNNFRNTDLSGFPYYNILFMYGFSCEQDLAELLTIQEQKQADFCDRHYPISPACKTHQAMGFLYMKKSGCENPAQVQHLIDQLAQDIQGQLTLDFRSIDVYLQRVLVLLQSGHNDKINPRWIARVLEAQNTDGGWDDFQPLIKIGNQRYFGLGSKIFEVSAGNSDFHATVQGTLLTAILIGQMEGQAG